MPAHLTTPPSPMPPTPRQDQSAMPGPSEPLAAAPRPDAASVQRPEAAPAPAPATGTGTGDFVKQFCEGAGLAPDAYGDVDPGVLARALGVSMRSVAVELMSLLQARDAAKQFTRGGERTMRRSTDNNPLKFLPDAEQAIEAMYLKHRAGFLNGPDGLSEALRDIRLHQNAVFAAIQPALAQLLSDLAPETIEEGVQGGMLGGGKKSKAWETFVARWDAKAHRHDNGMLDEFLVYFAKAYADVVASGKF
jgi:type VI secretion system FHA domain protein